MTQTASKYPKMHFLLRYDPLVEVVSANKWREDTDGDGGDELRAMLKRNPTFKVDVPR